MENSCYSPRILKLAEKVAGDLIKRNESTCEFNFAWNNGSLWISDNPDKIIGTEKIVVEGKNFFIGIFNK